MYTAYTVMFNFKQTTQGRFKVADKSLALNHNSTERVLGITGQQKKCSKQPQTVIINAA